MYLLSVNKLNVLIIHCDCQLCINIIDSDQKLLYLFFLTFIMRFTAVQVLTRYCKPARDRLSTI